MLDEKRVQEAEKNIKMYLEDGLIEKARNDLALKRYTLNSDLSLETAEKLTKLEDSKYKPYLWIIVTSYYSMFYIANAVLLQIGYKVGDKISHKVTSDALIALARSKLKKGMIEDYEKAEADALELISSKVDSLLMGFDSERIKRSKFQYEMDEEIKRDKATTSLSRAKDFVFEMKKLIFPKRTEKDKESKQNG